MENPVHPCQIHARVSYGAEYHRDDRVDALHTPCTIVVPESYHAQRVNYSIQHHEQETHDHESGRSRSKRGFLSIVPKVPNYCKKYKKVDQN